MIRKEYQLQQDYIKQSPRSPVLNSIKSMRLCQRPSSAFKVRKVPREAACILAQAERHRLEGVAT